MTDEFPAAPPGDPEQLRTAVTGMRTMAAELGGMVPYLRGIVHRLIEQAWRGEASVAFVDHCDHIQWMLGQAGDQVGQMAGAGQQWAAQLEEAQRRHAEAEERYQQARQRVLAAQVEIAHTPAPTDPLSAFFTQVQDLGSPQARLAVAEADLREAIADGQAAVEQAQLAEDDAAQAYHRIAALSFGGMTDDLFGPTGPLAREAALSGRAGDAVSFVADVTGEAAPAPWDAFGDRLGLLGTVTGGVAAGQERHAADANNPFLSPQARSERAMEDAVVRGLASGAGGAGASAATLLIFRALGFVPHPLVKGLSVAVVAYLAGKAGDNAAQDGLAIVRGEAGVPREHSAVPEGNEVVAPPDQPRPPTSSGYPASLPGPESEPRMGIRRELPPTPLQQDSAREQAEAWAQAQEVLQEGVPQPRPAPQVLVEPEAPVSG